MSCAIKESDPIQDISEQWEAIESRMLDPQTAQDDNRFCGDIDLFRASIEAFLASETYRIYCFAPFLAETKFSLDPAYPSPHEIPGFLSVARLAVDLSEAVSQGEWEKVTLISEDISLGIINVEIVDAEAERYVADAYLHLLLLFLIFFIFTVIVIWSLYRALFGSLIREAESSRFSWAMLLVQEEERARLHRELHDTLAQDLRYLSMSMEKIGLCPDIDERVKLCDDASNMQSALISRVRDICSYLVPPDFHFHGLCESLKWLCLDFRKRSGLDCRITIQENIDVSFLDMERQLQVFRIVQEALTNVEKHAEAAEVIVTARNDPDGNLFIGISDDGKGFEPPGGKVRYKGTHIGLRSMSERAALLGGSLEINSGKETGTQVRLKIYRGRGN